MKADDLIGLAYCFTVGVAFLAVLVGIEFLYVGMRWVADRIRWVKWFSR